MTTATRWPGSGRDWAVLTLSWAAVCVLLVWLMWGHMANLYFRDPDDALRLVEVRAWIAGQSWFDVTQYRVSPPIGGPMHWWRLLDVPIGLGIAALTPLLGRHGAEVATLTVYPLLLLGLFLYTMGRIGARLGGTALAGLTAAYAGTQFYTVNQFAPLRIDHHGWQLILAVLLFGLFICSPTPRRMLLSGAVLAAYFCISLEALPYALLFGVVPALAYVRSDAALRPLALFIAATAGAAVLLTLATRGLDPFVHAACDALTLPYLAALVTAALLLSLLGRLLPRGMGWRIGVLALTGGGALAALLLTAPQCSGGPFGQLDPLVYQIWYQNIPEGRPIFQQNATMILAALLPSLFALIGGVLGWRAAPDAQQRRGWGTALWLTLGSMLVTLSVARGMYVANAFAAPGGALLLLYAVRRARAVDRTAIRIIATAATAVLLPLIPTGLIGGAVSRHQDGAIKPSTTEAGSCRDPASAVPLQKLPQSVLFAPIDLGPAILTQTNHAVVVTGHHRNNLELKRTILAFTGSPTQAHAAVAGSAADYLVYCPDAPEMSLYADYEKHGLVERLEHGDTPSWLAPVHIPADRGYRIYRIVRPAPASVSAAAPASKN